MTRPSFNRKGDEPEFVALFNSADDRFQAR